jgi:MFS family permease
MFFLGVLFMQHVLGYSALGTGFAFLPVSVGIGILSLGFSARLNMRFGPKPTLLVGLLLAAAALAWIARAPVGASYAPDLLPAMLLLGIGAGLSFPSLMTLSMSGATPADAGLASGLVNTTMQVGGALGIAVLATLSSTRTAHLLATHVSQNAALTGGYHLAWVVSASLVGVAMIVALLVLRSAKSGAPVAEDPVTAESAGAVAPEPAYTEAV